MGVALLLLWGISVAAIDLLSLGPWLWAGVPVVVVLVFGVFARWSNGLAAGGLAAGWCLAAYVEVTGPGHWLVSHVGPVGALLAVSLITRQVDVRSAKDLGTAIAVIPRAAPLIAPLVLVVLVIPSLSQDVWVAADSLNVGRLLVLAVLTIGLLFALVLRHLRAELPKVLASRTVALAADPRRVDLTRAALEVRLSDSTNELVQVESSIFILDAWPADGREYADFLAATTAKRLTSPLVGRLGLCAAAVAVAVSLYLYAIINVVVPPAVASEWTGSGVDTHGFNVVGTTLVLAGGPYFIVTGLLTILAVATFLSFVLIEDRFSVALGDALLRLPVDQMLALALPYLALVERAVKEGDPLPADFDVGAFGVDSSS